MIKKLTKEEQQVWDRLKYGLPAPFQTINVASNLPVYSVTGSIVFNTTDARMYIFDGCTWKTVT